MYRCDENYNKLCYLELARGTSDMVVTKG